MPVILYLGPRARILPSHAPSNKSSILRSHVFILVPLMMLPSRIPPGHRHGVARVPAQRTHSDHRYLSSMRFTCFGPSGFYTIRFSLSPWPAAEMSNDNGHCRTALCGREPLPRALFALRQHSRNVMHPCLADWRSRGCWQALGLRVGRAAAEAQHPPGASFSQREWGLFCARKPLRRRRRRTLASSPLRARIPEASTCRADAQASHSLATWRPCVCNVQKLAHCTRAGVLPNRARRFWAEGRSV